MVYAVVLLNFICFCSYIVQTARYTLYFLVCYFRGKVLTYSGYCRQKLIRFPVPSNKNITNSTVLYHGSISVIPLGVYFALKSVVDRLVENKSFW